MLVLGRSEDKSLKKAIDILNKIVLQNDKIKADSKNKTPQNVTNIQNNTIITTREKIFNNINDIIEQVEENKKKSEKEDIIDLDSYLPDDKNQILIVSIC